MTVTNFTEDGGQYFIEVIGNEGTHFTFVFETNGGTDARVASIMTEGFKISPRQGKERTEAYGEARRHIISEADGVDDVWMPSQATTVFNND